MMTVERAAQALAKIGGDLIDPPVLIEAKVPLELSGEAVRSRICTFVDQDGLEWALRPDLTLVVAQAEVNARRVAETGQTIRRYCGPVFRLPAIKDEPVEYDQVGLEKFGAPRSVDEDVWLFSTLTATSQSCGVDSGHASFGDLSIFPAFVDAMNVSADVSAGLKRAFRQAGGVRAYLSGQARNRSGLSRRLVDMPREDVAAFVDDIFAMTGVRPVGERSAEEIVERLFERSKSAGATALSDEQAAMLERLLSLDLPFEAAPDALDSIAADGALNGLDAVLTQFRDRTEKLAASAPRGFVASARFATRFGRRFTYYDGFVFEVAKSDADDAICRPFIAGGRYDTLLADLSDGAVSATALGGIVIPHRFPRETGAGQ